MACTVRAGAFRIRCGELARSREVDWLRLVEILIPNCHPPNKGPSELCALALKSGPVASAVGAKCPWGTCVELRPPRQVVGATLYVDQPAGPYSRVLFEYSSSANISKVTRSAHAQAGGFWRRGGGASDGGRRPGGSSSAWAYRTCGLTWFGLLSSSAIF